ncbi:energy transducer TonB [Tunturiibacter lichenicola]|uniref:energy transducer TonB n=1 Tax=Tunturiibacter lichenicola TaxID=2051959 RepID=UPI003D9BDF28
MERNAETPKEPLNSGDVAEWLHKVSSLNGLQSADIQPWHIVITYDQFDEDGDNVHSGVVEELWANPKKYKISYKSDALTQTDYATDQGLYRLGDQRWPNPAEIQVRAEIVDPFSFASKLRGLTSSSEENTFGTHTLHCVAFKKTGGISVSNQYCFEQSSSVLRYVRGQGWDQTTYNDIISFRGRSVAQQVNVTNGGKPFLKLTVKALEPITQLDENDFTPPNNAVSLIGKRVTGVLRQPVKMSFPEWPESLRQQHFIIGLQIVIGQDGHVVSAQAISGPADAYKSAENAVRKWVFEPYLVLGEPSEVETKVQLSNQ